MTDEQYSRLFRLALRSARFRHNNDPSLITRGYAYVIERKHQTDNRTAITEAGLQRLEQRLTMAREDLK